MDTKDDPTLLREFAQLGRETAFGEIVRRHLDSVYSTALRLTDGQSGLAQDIAQKVFTDLARKAHSLPPATLLGGWLYRATRLATVETLRSEGRRAAREKEASMLQEINRPEDSTVWDGIRPLLDDALVDLKELDREALLLRFFQRRSLREVGSALGVSEDAARMRIERALERLRGVLASRGVSSTAAALGFVLETNAVVSAPTVLAQTLATTAITAANISATTLSTVTIMSATTAKIAGPLAIAVMFAVPLFLQHRSIQRLKIENAALRSAENAPATRAESPAADPDNLDQLKLEVARLRSEMASKRALEKELAAAQSRLAQRPKQAPPSTPSGDASEEAKDSLRQVGLARMSFARDLGLNLLMYADKHGGRLPAAGDDVSSVMVPPVEVHGVRIDMESFELLPNALAHGIGNGSVGIIGRDREPWPSPNGQISRTYLFSDGHSEIRRYNSTAEMDTWEAEHGPKQSGN